MTDFGSQRLYAEPEAPIQVADRIELPVDDVEFPTHLPPTLDKMINGQDTAPNEDPWLVDPPPPLRPTRKERRAAKRAQRRAEKSRKKQLKRPSNPGRRREILSIFMELLGISAVSYGFWLISPRAGFICLGACLILMGYAISRDLDDGSS